MAEFGRQRRRNRGNIEYLSGFLFPGFHSFNTRMCVRTQWELGEMKTRFSLVWEDLKIEEEGKLYNFSSRELVEVRPDYQVWKNRRNGCMAHGDRERGRKESISSGSWKEWRGPSGPRGVLKVPCQVFEGSVRWGGNLSSSDEWTPQVIVSKHT